MASISEDTGEETPLQVSPCSILIKEKKYCCFSSMLSIEPDVLKLRLFLVTWNRYVWMEWQLL